MEVTPKGPTARQRGQNTPNLIYDKSLGATWPMQRFRRYSLRTRAIRAQGVFYSRASRMSAAISPGLS